MHKILRKEVFFGERLVSMCGWMCMSSSLYSLSLIFYTHLKDCCCCCCCCCVNTSGGGKRKDNYTIISFRFFRFSNHLKRLKKCDIYKNQIKIWHKRVQQISSPHRIGSGVCTWQVESTHPCQWSSTRSISSSYRGRRRSRRAYVVFFVHISNPQSPSPKR